MKTEEKKTQHTPGPLEIRTSSNPKNGTDWRDIVSIGGEFAPSYVGEALEKDAHRFVAAWNACEGIPTKALEGGIVGEMREALEAVLEIPFSDIKTETEIYGKVRAALAKLKGE